MKINFQKTLPIVIAIVGVVIITLSTIWYGTDPLWWWVVGAFAVLGGIILVSVVRTKRKK